MTLKSTTTTKTKTTKALNQGVVGRNEQRVS
jgi:hypothetical protein